MDHLAAIHLCDDADVLPDQHPVSILLDGQFVI